MMSTLTKPGGIPRASEPPPEESISYRSVSKAAIFSVTFALLSLTGFFHPALLFFAVTGLVLGLLALRTISRYPDELTGTSLALVGAALCVLTFFGGLTTHIVVYATEMPAGYDTRVSFSELQPDPLRRPDLPVSPRAIELDGQKIFIKGYVHPEYSRGEVKRFVMVPDMGTCCFGGQPKLTDMIEVTLRDPHRIRYNQRLRKLAGVFKVDTTPKPVSGLGGVYYQLDAEYAK